MPIIPIYSGQLARQDPNEPDPNSPWNGLDEKIMRGLMVGTQLKKAGIEARAAEQDIQAKQQSMGMAAERQGWARQEQGWKAREQGWRESDRERAERIRLQGGEAAMNLYNIQYGQQENLAAQGMGGDWAVSTEQAQAQNSPEAQAEMRRRMGMEYASTLEPELQKTYLEGLDKAIHGRLLGDSVKSATGDLQNFIGDLDASDASGKYDIEIKGLQQRLDAIANMAPEQAYDESLRLRKEMSATKEIIKNEEFRIAKIPGALDSVNNIVQNMKSAGNWENNPNRGSIDQIMKNLLFDRSTVDPDKALADAEQFARGYRKMQMPNGFGGTSEYWVSESEHARLMQARISANAREAIARENAAARVSAAQAEASQRAAEERSKSVEAAEKRSSQEREDLVKASTPTQTEIKAEVEALMDGKDTYSYNGSDVRFEKLPPSEQNRIAMDNVSAAKSEAYRSTVNKASAAMEKDRLDAELQTLSPEDRKKVEERVKALQNAGTAAGAK